ncbi:GntR family transcriptional regulator [Microvirga guangxiensis]|uniref:DNA-binding transcriptional regulator, GntR family n=1 Tax=Microvirga guangxiensis TaxID=549386 RepID=A0A1G5KL67_9HYPH|nr:GntR family transcriptional regulator [Microvirga guangxiensis]SCZ01357.1 DNA-binding transcriptional regulator, GntR family [Microvirga guangxiensis]
MTAGAFSLESGALGKTLGESVRSHLAGLIIRGEFKEGERLYPEQIAARFGVSITPVREALMQLAAEGFIESVQRRGFHVRIPTADQIRNVWQVRQSLELCAGEQVIKRLKEGTLDPHALDRLDALQKAQLKNTSHMDHATKLELNGSFHTTIIEFAGNPILASMYRSLQHKVVGGLVQSGLDTWRSRVEKEGQEHKAIIDGLRNQDYAAYDSSVRTHIARSLDDALRDLATRQ